MGKRPKKKYTVLERGWGGEEEVELLFPPSLMVKRVSSCVLDLLRAPSLQHSMLL
jgi:hypothetical protein